MRIGFHVGISGGLDKALERAVDKGCETMQVFISNPRGWRHTQPTPAAGESFRAGCAAAGIHPVFVHTIYLINLASASDEVYRRSLDSLTSNLRAGGLIGAEAVVTHLGSHGGEGLAAGLRRIIAALESSLEATPGGPDILLETTSGAGNAMGSCFEHLGRVFRSFKREKRLGVCVDTCHVFAAGYDVRTRAGLKKTLAALDREVGLERVRLVHANDSRGALGSQLDRHEHIGQGEIGLEGFRVLACDPFLRDLPWILETPVNTVGADRDNLATLQGLCGR